MCLGLFQACSEEDNSNISSDLNSIENPETLMPKAALVAQSEGLYLGSVISSDLEFHGKIMINAGNDSHFNAKIEFPNGDRLIFAGSLNTTKSLDQIYFEDKTGDSSFTLDISDYTNPIASNFKIQNVASNMVLVKDDFNNRASVLIGNYVDVNNTAFAGVFDVFSNGTPHPYHLGASTITRTAFVTPGGTLFVDETMENFDFSICIEDINQTNFEPLMYVNEPGTDAHFYADKQTSDVGGIDLTWQMFKQFGLGYYIQFKNVAGYEDGCYETASGLWGWNGRYGVISFDFAESTNPTAELFEANSNSTIELTSDLIEAILSN